MYEIDEWYGEVDMRYNGTEFEFGRGVNHSINELVSYFGSNYSTKYIPRKGEYPITLCDDESTKEILNWNPTKNLDDYIRDFVETQRFLDE